MEIDPGDETCRFCGHHTSTAEYVDRWETPEEFYDRGKSSRDFYERIGVPKDEYGHGRHWMREDDISGDSRVMITEWFWNGATFEFGDANLCINFVDATPTDNYEKFRQQIHALDRSENRVEVIYVKPTAQASKDNTLTVTLGDRNIGIFTAGIWAFTKND
jgi:hypothetical protein